jgi:hypothetical protein
MATTPISDFAVLFLASVSVGLLGVRLREQRQQQRSSRGSLEELAIGLSVVVLMVLWVTKRGHSQSGAITSAKLANTLSRKPRLGTTGAACGEGSRLQFGHSAGRNVSQAVVVSRRSAGPMKVARTDTLGTLFTSGPSAAKRSDELALVVTGDFSPLANAPLGIDTLDSMFAQVAEGDDRDESFALLGTVDSTPFRLAGCDSLGNSSTREVAASSQPSAAPHRRIAHLSLRSDLESAAQLDAVKGVVRAVGRGKRLVLAFDMTPTRGNDDQSADRWLLDVTARGCDTAAVNAVGRAIRRHLEPEVALRFGVRVSSPRIAGDPRVRTVVPRSRCLAMFQLRSLPRNGTTRAGNVEPLFALRVRSRIEEMVRWHLEMMPM